MRDKLGFWGLSCIYLEVEICKPKAQREYSYDASGQSERRMMKHPVQVKTAGYESGIVEEDVDKHKERNAYKYSGEHG